MTGLDDGSWKPRPPGPEDGGCLVAVARQADQLGQVLDLLGRILSIVERLAAAPPHAGSL